MRAVAYGFVCPAKAEVYTNHVWLTVVTVLSFGAAVWIAGCAAPQRTFRPARDPNMLDDVAFLHYLATVPVVTVDEGMRGLLLLRGEGAKPVTFNERHVAFCRLGVVKASWHLSPGQILDKGTLAYMLREVCGLRRGFNERLAGVVALGERRYALKACVDQGLMSYGLAREAVSGGDMLSALTNAEHYLASKSADLRP